MVRNFLNTKENMADLVTLMPHQHQSRYRWMRNLRIDSAFLDRVYVVYKQTELDSNGRQKDPIVLGMIKVVEFTVDAKKGSNITIMDVATGDEQDIGHVPQQIFDWDCYVSVPPENIVKWDAWDCDGERRRSMSFGMLFKTSCRTESPIVGATMVDTLNGFRRNFPNMQLGKY